MEACKLMGIDPSGRTTPLHVDDIGRLELSATFIGDSSPHVLLGQVLLSGADATLYTAAANWRDVVVYLKNVDTGLRTCQLALGATATDTNSLVKNLVVEVGGRVPVFVPALAVGSVLRGLCDSASKISIEIWGKPA